jgi:hypothetical protein
VAGQPSEEMKPRNLILALLCLLLIGYPLSLGPVLRFEVWQMKRASPGSDFMLLDPPFYIPLHWMRRQCSPLNTALSWYESIWLQGT